MRTILIAIAAIVIALSAAFGVGYLYGESKAEAKCELDKAKIQAESVGAEELAKRDAEIRTLKIEIANQAKTQQIEVIKTKVVEKIIQSPPQRIEVKENGEVTYLPFVFDSDTVRLLNEARKDETYRNAFGYYGNSEDVATVGLAELIENDLEVVTEYHNLANRYRELQSFVRDHIEEGYQFCKIAK